MISFREAKALVLDKATSFGNEVISLEEALGRVLAEDVMSPRDLPPFNRSAMDGVALDFKDLSRGLRKFKYKETIFAGKGHQSILKPGECYKIMTGAAVPFGANVVIRIEDVTEESGDFHIRIDDFRLHQNVALQGQDLKTGSLAVAKGCLINAPIIGLLAALGKERIKVERLPVVNLITTGDEVVALDEEVAPFQIYNSNLYTLKALLKENLIQVRSAVHVKDDVNDLSEIIKAHLNTDILILTGGVSAGEADFIPSVLNDLGVQQLFHKVAIKPGKPLWCGTIHRTIVFALPGNPFSVMVTFKLFVEPYIKKSLGFPADGFSELPMNFEKDKQHALDEFFPVIVNSSGLNSVVINGSGDIRLGNQANALAMQAADVSHLNKGDRINYLVL